MSWTPLEKVVVPIDFSESSGASVREAIDMTKRPDCVHVLHVVPHVEKFMRMTLAEAPDEAEQIESAKRHLATWVASNEFDGVRQDVVVGDPGTMIVEYADDAGAELIVIPSHGRSGIKRVVLGSVAERVVRHARCPVYVLRRPDAA